jgi:predicted outer membrane repeat protein
LLFISICLTSCTPATEINVACDVGDLIDAINDANADSDTTRLILDPNCTYPITNVDNTSGGAGPNALPLITTKIVIEGNNAILTNIPALGNRFFFITHSGNLRLEDITLENGYSFPGDNPNNRGGAIYNDGGALRAERTVFFDNNAGGGEGGAIYNLGILTLEDTLFENNSSDNGGAIYNGGTMDIAAVLQGVTLDANFAHNNGGAIYNASTEQGFLISGSTFENNHSYFHGGAIFTESADLDISNSEFLENKAGRGNTPDPDWGDGGAIYSLAGDVTLIATNFNQQTAFGVGGDLYAGPGSDVRLREVKSEDSEACHGGGALYVEGETEILQTTLKNSRAGGLGHGWGWGTYNTNSHGCWNYPGGAIYNTGTLALDQSLIENSTAMGDGDGVYNIGDLIVVNSTFHFDCCYEPDAINNQGSTEVSLSTFVYSGLVNSGIMTVKNIVVAANTNGCINSGTFVEMDENISLDPACPFSTILASQFPLRIDLLNLSDNGGPTLTNRVKWDSPVINMATCSTVAGDYVSVDQRGETRPYPGSGSHDCDIGATEVHDLSPPEDPLHPTQMPGNSPSCDPFEGEEISLMMQSLPADTRNQVMYIKVEDGNIPGLDPEELNGEPLYDFEAKLGKIASYQCGLQGFPDRLYCLFHIPEGMDGTSQLFELRLNDCPDPVYLQPNVFIPVPNPSSSDPTGPVCTVDLISPDCEAAGGQMSSGTTTAQKCVCP